MRISIKKSAALLAALAMATTGVLSLNSTTAKAATVATVKPGVTARLYTSQGYLITNRALAPNTPWRVGKIVKINGGTFYQVATNEYLQASDSTLNDDNSQAIGTIVNGSAPIYYTMTKGEIPAARNLPNGSTWKVDRAIKDTTGAVYYEVASNQWISAKNMTVNKAVETVNSNTNFSAFSSKGKVAVNPQKPTNNQTSNSNPDTASVAAAVLKSINDERAAKGVAPLSQTAALTNTANIRAKEISVKFDHQRPNGSMCFSAFPDGWGTEEENIAYRYKRPANEIAANIMNSFRAENFVPSHYTNVLSPDVKTVGVGVYRSGDRYYVAEDFMG